MHPLDHANELSYSGKLIAAETILRKADQSDPRVQYNLGWFDMYHGRFTEAFEGFHVGRSYGAFGNAPIPGEMWSGQSLAGKTVLFRGEGGYGDQIINFRFVKDFEIRGARVIISARSGLWPLYARLGYHCISEQAADAGWCHYDYWVPAMSAPYLLGYELDTMPNVPYIRLPRRKSLAHDFNVGVRWGGLEVHDTDLGRRVDPHELLSAVNRPGRQVYSFQRDADLIDLPDDVVDLQHQLTDWLATAEWLNSMNLVISSCTATAHMAAAMGIETWVLIPMMPYYIWAPPGDESPWYDSVTLIRQHSPGQWHFGRIAQMLKERDMSHAC